MLRLRLRTRIEAACRFLSETGCVRGERATKIAGMPFMATVIAPLQPAG